MRKRNIRVNCKCCDGSGKSGTHKCWNCEGMGYYYAIIGYRSSQNMYHPDGDCPITEKRTCHTCDGTGKLKTDCHFCYGYGCLYDIGGGNLQIVGPSYGNGNGNGNGSHDPDYNYKMRLRLKKDNVKR